jgi:GNAT superfamily N-acetyltransferase
VLRRLPPVKSPRRPARAERKGVASLQAFRRGIVRIVYRLESVERGGRGSGQLVELAERLNYRDLASDLRDNGALWWVRWLFHEDCAVALAEVRWDDPKLFLGAPPHLWIFHIGVIEELRSTGLGTRLLRMCAAEAQERGCHGLGLEVKQGADAERRRRFFRASGLVPIETPDDHEVYGASVVEALAACDRRLLDLDHAETRHA